MCFNHEERKQVRKNEQDREEAASLSLKENVEVVCDEQGVKRTK